MKLEFVRHPLYVAIQSVCGLAMIGGGLASGYTTFQRDQCRVESDRLGTHIQARLVALQTREDKVEARESNLKARDPELAKKLHAPQSEAN